MNWAKTMGAYSSVTSSERYSGDPGETGGATPEGWNPYEVWLTRIYQPGERTARVATDDPWDSAAIAHDLAPAR